MQFYQFSDLISQQLTNLTKTGKLFKSSITGQQLWDIYITSFKPENNPVFRDPNSSEHNCNTDKSFIRRYGNLVTINDDLEIVTLFDIDVPKNSQFYDSVIACKKALKKAKIENVFFETFEELNSLPYEKTNKKQELYRLGIKENHKIYTQEEADKYGVVKVGEVYKFHHFYADLPKQFVDFSGKSQESIIAEYRDAKNVFQRGMETIPEDTLKLVKDLINQGSLLDGTTHVYKIDQMLPLKIKYDGLPKSEQDNYCWVASYKLPFAKFRNELIGTLCVELAEGKELNEACQAWNKRVDPANYMKASAPITQRQIKEAQKFVEENGYTESFNRRFVTIDDINVNEILHSNVGDNKIKTASIFDKVQPSQSTRHKRSQFDALEEVSIDKFMKDILPTCTSIEAFVENRMSGNLLALTTANVLDSKQMFKWSNNFSWTYNGNLAGKSMIKENVKAVGGKVTGLLRCSLQWNDEDTPGIVDFDLHCKTPFDEIYYSNKECDTSGGWLDVDMVNPRNIGIENITWQEKLKDGNYDFFVRNFNGNGNKGFKTEIEFDGNVYNYHHSTPTSYKQDVKIATINVKNGIISIKHHLEETNNSKKIWNLDTNEFHKVNLVCLSPNHWGDNNTGNKHYLFMIENCKTDVSLRSFHNENLNSDLLQHRKVTEVLANTTMLEPSEKQLCGLGFNATVKDELILKLKGSFSRTIKIKFNN